MFLRVLLIDWDPAPRRELRQYLEAMHQVVVAGEISGAKEALLAAKAGVEVAIVAIPEGSPETKAMDVIAELLRVAPGISVVAAGPGNSADLVIRAIRAGAVEFLTRPISRNDVTAAIEKIRRLRGVSPATEGRAGRIISVFATKGGLGVTTLASNLAVCLTQHVPDSTMLIDLDIRQGGVTTLLNIQPTYSALDAFDQPGRLDEAYLRGLLARHSSGLQVLAAPAEVGSFHFTSEQMRKGLEIIRFYFKQIVVDLPNDLDPGTLTTLEESNEILYLVGLNVPAVRSASAGLAALRHLGIDQRKVKIVVSRANAREDVNVKQVQEALGLSIFWRIPNDYPTVSASINDGVPLVLSAPKTGIARNLRKLAETLDHARTRVDKGKETSLSLARRVFSLS